MDEYPHLLHRPGDGPPAAGVTDEVDWLVLVDSDGDRRLAFQQVERLEPTTWPEHDVPMLHRHRERAESLGARLLLDRTEDANEPLYVLADLSGHPFCIFVA